VTKRHGKWKNGCLSENSSLETKKLERLGASLKVMAD